MSITAKLLIVFFVLAASAFFLKRQIQTTCYFPTVITVDIATGNDDTYQLFYNTGSGYRQKESVYGNYSGMANQKVVFIIPGANFLRFRIDPGTKRGIVKISQIIAENNGFRKIWQCQELMTNFKAVNDISSFKCEDGIITVTITGNDPFFKYRGNLKDNFNISINTAKAMKWIALVVILNILIFTIVYFYPTTGWKLTAIPEFISKLSITGPRNVFLFAAVVWGSLTVFITPPFQAADEDMHFYRTYQLSSGRIFSDTRNNLIGSPLPKSLDIINSTFQKVPNHPENKVSIADMYKVFQVPLKPGDTTFYRLTCSAHYNPVPYLPQVLAITIPRLLQVPPIYLLYAGRLGNLFIWTLLVYLAIVFTPVGKWLFTLIALLPMTVTQASSLSPDAMTIGLAFLLIGSIFRIAFDDSRNIKPCDLFLIGLISVLLALSKNTYFFLILLVFLIPPGKFSSIKHYILSVSCIFFATGLALVIGSYFVTHVIRAVDLTNGLYSAIPEYPQHVDPYKQLVFIMSNKFSYVESVLSTVWSRKLFFAESFIGRLGRLDAFLPGNYIKIAYVILGLTAIADNQQGIAIGIWRKFVILTCILSVVFVMCTILYMSWTPVGRNQIEGLQGRYFIPFSPLVFLLFHNRYVKLPEYIVPFFSVIFIVVSFLIMNYTMIFKYYL